METEIAEYNHKLISIYMDNYTIIKDSGFSWIDIKGNCFHCFKDMPYNLSYDWLIPVLEKIENCKYVFETIIQFDDVCKIHSCTILPSLKNTFESIYWKGKTKIEAIYYAVIDYIKWYNKQVTK